MIKKKPYTPPSDRLISYGEYNYLISSKRMYMEQCKVLKGLRKENAQLRNDLDDLRSKNIFQFLINIFTYKNL